jgi:hypothetical protein
VQQRDLDSAQQMAGWWVLLCLSIMAYMWYRSTGKDQYICIAPSSGTRLAAWQHDGLPPHSRHAGDPPVLHTAGSTANAVELHLLWPGLRSSLLW